MRRSTSGKVTRIGDDEALVDYKKKLIKAWSLPKQKNVLFYKWADTENKISSSKRAPRRFKSLGRINIF